MKLKLKLIFSPSDDNRFLPHFCPTIAFFAQFWSGQNKKFPLQKTYISSSSHPGVNEVFPHFGVVRSKTSFN